MEKSLDKCLDDLLAVQGVVGVLCADDKGLCLQNKGKTSPVSAGLVAELSNIAGMLEPSRESPAIFLESDTTNVLIKNVGKVTTVIYKLAR